MTPNYEMFHQRRGRHSLLLISSIGLLLLGLCSHPRISQALTTSLNDATLTALFIGVILAGLSLWRASGKVALEGGAPPLIVWRLRHPHVIQTIAQSLIYIAWCQAWPTANEHLPLLLAQVAFAYLIDMALSWFKYHNYKIGLAPIPIVLSINLFLFFRDDYFVWQWGLIAIALVSKELFRWKREGRDVHIFNPSAIALSMVAIILIYTDTMHFTWGETIARAHGFSPYSYEVIFAAGLLVSAFFTVGFTIVSAAIFTLILGEWYFDAFGIYRYLDTGIPIAVFLGMNLLVTDPVSSPWRRDSKILYGILYGLSVFLLYGFLRDLERPPSGDDIGLSAAFCDKLLAVPILNLLSPFLDTLMKKMFDEQRFNLSARVASWERALSVKVIGKQWLGRGLFIALWALIFMAWVRPSVREHPGKDVRFWIQACEETSDQQRHKYACENRDRIYLRACESGALPACHNLALTREEQDPKLAIQLYGHACEGGQATSCNHLGGMLFMKAESSGDTGLLNEAESRLRVACKQNIYEACTRQATLLRSRWLDRSQWKEKDWRGLWDLLNRACDGGEPFACFELSQLNLMHPQTATARCRDGDDLMCVALQARQNLAFENHNKGQLNPMNMLYRQPDFQPVFTQARGQLVVACSASIQLACINLAWMTWRGDGGVKDQGRAMKMMQVACDKGERSACERLSWMRQNTHP